MKLVTIVGARPQFIKASALSRALASYPDVEEVIIHTGQHFDENMSAVFFEEMDIPAPKYNLDIHSLGHGAMTGRMLEEIEKILVVERPDFVVVYGDTNSTLAGALAAKKLHIQVVHIEAGLRSFNMDMPEEVNRILTDRISDILFCPTMTAVQNLKMEGFESFDSKVYNSGDIMYDAALFFKDKAANKASIYSGMDLKENEFILATIHRQENTDNQARLRSIINVLNNIHRSKPVIVPLHPRTQSILKKLGIQPEFRVIEPVGYLDMIALTSHAYLVLTDSGGLQKEAYFFGKYCITLRDQTEWVELVNHGLNQLTGADEDKIWEAYQSVDYATLNFDVQLYGNGQAAHFIIEKLRAHHTVIE